MLVPEVEGSLSYHLVRLKESYGDTGEYNPKCAHKVDESKRVCIWRNVPRDNLRLWHLEMMTDGTRAASARPQKVK